MWQFSFLNTGLLVFAAATILPLLIWLLAKRKPKEIVFSSLRFIKLSKDEEKKRTRLKNILLLIIRMLIILLVVLSASRPLLDSPLLRSSSKHPPTAIAVILDTSCSMDYLLGSKTILDSGKEALTRINSLTTNGDKIILITSDEGWNKLHTQIYAEDIPADLFPRLAVTYAPLEIGTLISLAEKKLADTQMQNREIYLITDRQQANYPEDTKLKINLIPLPAITDYSNLSCSQAEPQPMLVDKSRSQLIKFNLRNYGARERREVLVKAVLNGVKVAEKFVDLKGREQLNESLILDIRQDGWQSGYIEVLDDRQTHDNRAYFAFPFYLSPRVTVISSSPGIPLFLSSLLSVYSGSGAQPAILDPAAVNEAALDDQSLVVVHNLREMNPKLREILSLRSKEKKGVLYTVGRDMSASYKSYLDGVFGIRTGSYQSGDKTIDFVNRHHYISSLVADQTIRNKTVTDYIQARGNTANRILGAGEDILVTVRDKDALWLFDLDSRRNRFLLDASFPVMAFRTLQNISTSFSAVDTYLVGDVVSATDLALPDGTSLKLDSRGYKLTEPGIYQLGDSKAQKKLIAVDPDYREADYREMDFRRFKNYRLLSPNWQKEIFLSRMGHDLWKILLLMALGLMAVEIILVKLEEARPGKPEQTIT
ncbi:MAG TPA: BatA domain-containing protein [Candidatus Cloacimonadota bacterium]|nr:BatA domain-containing protein [Candidatus Cloacimonadota bacterium]